LAGVGGVLSGIKAYTMAASITKIVKPLVPRPELDFFLLSPQCGQASALADSCPPHVLQLMSFAMMISFYFIFLA